jgi:hypothetical protein
MCYGQQNSKWEKWNWLTGEWKGEGAGKPGQGNGVFSFAPDLNSQVIIRKSHTDFPAMDGKPAFVHEDLLVVYSDPSTKGDEAIYFDNEGHTIRYKISYTVNSIILTSEKVSNTPAFRLSYVQIDNKSVNVRFEMSQDGETFNKYLEGKSIRIK